MGLSSFAGKVESVLIERARSIRKKISLAHTDGGAMHFEHRGFRIECSVEVVGLAYVGQAVISHLGTVKK
jgi:hypothetical protein